MHSIATVLIYETTKIVSASSSSLLTVTTTRMTKESESTRKRMDDWQTSISTILSRANDNLNSRPRYDNWIKKPPLYTSPVFPVGESEVAPQVIVIKQSTERPKQMVDESIATSVTRNASAQHTLNNSQLNNSINQAIHSDYQQQVCILSSV